jgi:hypothetical protein
MNRRGFIRNLLAGGAVAAVAPKEAIDEAVGPDDCPF